MFTSCLAHPIPSALHSVPLPSPPHLAQILAIIRSTAPANLTRATRCVVAQSIDLKLHLSTTDYGNFLANEPVCTPLRPGTFGRTFVSPFLMDTCLCLNPLCLQSPLAVSVIDDKLKEKMVAEFVHIRKQAVEPLATFLDFIT